jgi:glycosyltransferase involved in cell wall biosynthesis
MKIAVYTIALNEEKFVERWYESAKDADYLLIADTGSTDKTIRIAKKLGINVIKISVSPWRFDDARNAALAALPNDIDYCVSMDMDETLSENWRTALEKMTGTQIEHMFHFTFRDKEEKHPESSFIACRVHKRHGYRWKWLVHEAIVPDRIDAVVEFSDDFIMEHHPDPDKSRQQYDKMIEDAFNEYKIGRYYIYHAMQLTSFDRLDEATEVWKEFLKLDEPITSFNRASAYRWLAKCDVKKQKSYWRKSLKTMPTRETYLELAIHHYNKQNWKRCEYYASKALDIKIQIDSLLRGNWSWGYLGHNLQLAARYNKKLFRWSKSYKQKKRIVSIGSSITHNFKLFED